MSVYHYVANKDEILDGIVDLVFSEIEPPVTGGEWRSEMRRRAISARRVLSRRPWAIALLQSRVNPGPATLRHHDAFIGTLRGAGFSVELTAHGQPAGAGRQTQAARLAGGDALGTGRAERITARQPCRVGRLVVGRFLGRAFRRDPPPVLLDLGADPMRIPTQ